MPLSIGLSNNFGVAKHLCESRAYFYQAGQDYNVIDSRFLKTELTFKQTILMTRMSQYLLH